MLAPLYMHGYICFGNSLTDSIDRLVGAIRQWGRLYSDFARPF